MPQLESLTLELTERCNLNCVHCYINLHENDNLASKKEVSLYLWQQILLDGYKLGCRQLKITGGEPLLRPDFIPLYTFAHKLGFSLSIATNATLVNPRVVRCLLKYPPSQIYISIYGWDELSYDLHTRTTGSFNRFLRGVRLLSNACLPVQFRIPPSRNLVENRHLIRSFSLKLSPTSDIDVGWYLTKRARPDEYQSRRILEYRLSPSQAADILIGNGIPSRKEHPTLVNKSCNSQIRLFACKAGNVMSIDAYGMLQLCIEMRHPSTLFNLLEHTLRDALAVHVPNMKSLVVTNRRYLQRCAVCKIRSLCYQCPGCSYSEDGSLDNPVDYICQVAHCSASKIGMLKRSI